MVTLFTRWIPIRQASRGTGKNGVTRFVCTPLRRRLSQYMLAVTVTLSSLVVIPPFIGLPLLTPILLICQTLSIMF